MDIVIKLFWKQPLSLNKVLPITDIVVNIPFGAMIVDPTLSATVTSVNGQTGDVVLTAVDVGATTEDYVDTEITTLQTTLQANIDTKANTSYVDQQDILLGNEVATALQALDDKKANATIVVQALSTKADLVGGVIPANQLPSFVDDVLEYSDLASFPLIGEASKIYVTIDTNKTYRWSSTQYVEIGGGGVALGETALTAYRGDRGKVAYDHSLSQGNPHNTTTSEISEGTNKYFTDVRVRNTVLSGLVKTDSSNVTNTDTIEIAVGKLAAKSEVSGSSGFNWVDITTIGSINTSNISYTSTNFPSDTCKIEFSRKDGMLWIRGDFYVTTSITATPTKIFEITDNNYKILHKIDSGGTYQLVSPTARGTTPTSSIFTYIPSRVDSIADIATVLEFRVSSISAAATAPVHIPPTCVGTLVI